MKTISLAAQPATPQIRDSFRPGIKPLCYYAFSGKPYSRSKGAQLKGLLTNRRGTLQKICTFLADTLLAGTILTACIYAFLTQLANLAG